MEGFFNGCLLRRPQRKFLKPGIDRVEPDFQFIIPAEVDPQKMGELQGYKQDPRLTTMVRYFSRDLANLPTIVEQSQQTGIEEFEPTEMESTEITLDEVL